MRSDGKPYVVGITGPIGSGKSTLCRALEAKGQWVYYSDTQAKAIIAHDEQVRAELIAHFGDEVFTPTGDYNPTWVARQVSDNREQLQWLNGIVHPAVAKEIETWRQTYPQREVLYVEAALFTQPFWQARAHAIVSVLADDEKRKLRVMTRDKRQKEEVERRMQMQVSNFIYKSVSQLVLRNVQTSSEAFLQEALPTLETFIREYLSIPHYRIENHAHESAEE